MYLGPTIIYNRGGFYFGRGGPKFFRNPKGGASFFLHKSTGGSSIFCRVYEGGPEKIDDPRSQTGGPPLPVKNDSSLKYI